MTISIPNVVATIKDALASWGIPGAVIGVTDQHHLQAVVVHGCADLKARTPLKEQDRFAIGSVSKSFTALAVLQLTDEGRVDLHAPIARYLPGLALTSPFEPISMQIGSVAYLGTLLQGLKVFRLKPTGWSPMFRMVRGGTCE